LEIGGEEGRLNLIDDTLGFADLNDDRWSRGRFVLGGGRARDQRGQLVPSTAAVVEPV
jgi:hypothetical protein